MDRVVSTETGKIRLPKKEAKRKRHSPAIINISLGIPLESNFFLLPPTPSLSCPVLILKDKEQPKKTPLRHYF